MLDKWAGAEIAEGGTILSPPEFFEAWDFNPAIIYERGYALFPGGTFGDLPETKWNELTVYGWVWLYPDATSIEITCDEDDGRSSSGNTVGRRDANQELCIQRDFDDTWRVFSDARDDLESVLAQDTQDAAQAEADIIRAEAALAEAQKTLDSLSEGLQAELLEMNLVVAQAALAAADSDLERLVSSDSDDTSIASGAQPCIRYASSYDEIRAASSELPGYFSISISLSFARTSSRARCVSGVIPSGGSRSTIGSPVERNRVPWLVAGLKPGLQSFGPPSGPPRWSVITTNAGRLELCAPRPYVTHEPTLGKPIRIWPDCIS